MDKIIFTDDTTPSVSADFLNALQDAIIALAGKESDVYNSSSTYAVGDIVTYSDKLYKCITEITTAEEWDSSKWKETSLKTLVKENIANIATNASNIKNLNTNKQDKLTAGKNITISEDNIISAAGGSTAPEFAISSGTKSVTTAGVVTENSSITLSKSGYKPIALAGFNSSNEKITFQTLYFNSLPSGSCNVNFRYSGNSSSSQTATLTVYVVWVKA